MSTLAINVDDGDIEFRSRTNSPLESVSSTCSLPDMDDSTKPYVRRVKIVRWIVTTTMNVVWTTFEHFAKTTILVRLITDEVHVVVRVVVMVWK